MNDLLATLMQHAIEHDGDNSPKIPVANQIKTLREVYDRYQAGCVYEPGDWVTPRRGYNLKSAGMPHVVVEVLDRPIRTFTDGAGDSRNFDFGCRLDMRVACIMQGRDGPDVALFWVESFAFEPFDLSI